MIYKVNTIHLVNQSVTELEFATYAKALAYYKEQCENYNIEGDEVELPFTTDTELSSGGRAYDVIVELNCIED